MEDGDRGLGTGDGGWGMGIESSNRRPCVSAGSCDYVLAASGGAAIAGGAAASGGAATSGGIATAGTVAATGVVSCVVISWRLRLCALAGRQAGSLTVCALARSRDVLLLCC